jgi:hypothetical protein
LESIEIDYLKVYNDLTAAKSTQTWFGKKMDKATKNSLSKWAKTRHDEQKGIIAETHARIDIENSEDINNILNELSVGNYSIIPENVNGKEWLAEKILNAQLTDKTKKAHINILNKVFPDVEVKDTDTTTYGSNEALSEWYDEILAGGYKKGNKFKQGILQDDRLTAKGKKWLFDTADKYEKERDAYSVEKIKTFMSGFDTTAIQGIDPRLIGWVNQNKVQLQSVLEEILAEGEAAGISIHAMLVDTKSPYYVGYKLMDIYSDSMMDIISRDKKSRDIKELLSMSSAEYFEPKRDQAYALFFDADPKLSGNQLAFEKAGYETEEGYVKALKEGTIDKTQTIFLQRLLNKPMPPERKWEGDPVEGGYESIDSYLESDAYKNYRKNMRIWIEEGGFNSEKIPSFKKFFGEVDMPTTKIKN